ncbi:uncharacterized protein CTHT_0015870 [Thermochaetoides thermophila DSM 1495]|uniref:GDP-Man:Man(3)GlcNAc(2)-PP-Dol alpha-1,2-mannosyltransferase n=1 Tax=Chaetomium thermophilum (strain DSM 1495 / CBS 144.50 / IMI 039719) TaxID=759272 RepID=G0S238_CHATD|nr:hypothetical protein CTHT_0015870 [Thermochaetoides thermophila DSM 1495]EGS23098.1 hypothetical protein CTHT_0015870 [Thermochaetoides thermophila DSM 1495]
MDDTDPSFLFPNRPLLIAALVILSPMVLPALLRLLGLFLGWNLRRKTHATREAILQLLKLEREEHDQSSTHAHENGDSDWEKLDSDVPTTPADGKTKLPEDRSWDGIIGFFHPFAAAGGGGERVLWAAIRALQLRYPRATCLIYTGDRDMTKSALLNRVHARFNIPLDSSRLALVYLSTRPWLLASTWPKFTLAGQSLGSIIVAWEALGKVVPDMFIDTMGYAFALGLAKWFFGSGMPTAAYVHYPTISTDMLSSLEDEEGTPLTRGLNAGQGRGWRGKAKRMYWRGFAKAYSWVGGKAVDVVMVNSSWTGGHIKELWGSYRKDENKDIEIVYPPVAVSELIRRIEVTPESESSREPVLLYIAQFRPEKNHTLIMQAYAHMLKNPSTSSETVKSSRLVLIGSVRDDGDAKRVYQLRLLANELGIRDRVQFVLDAPWETVLSWLGKASVGVNGMWNEHFGIGVVEYQAAGLISVVNDSGGPKGDIIVEVEGGLTGFHATTVEEYAVAFEKALTLPEPYEVRRRARVSALRFTEEEFARKWIVQMEKLVAMTRR